jgi:DNA-binding transcriptional LysR family regulator
MQRFYYKQNRIKQLRAFCDTAQTGSMSQTAEKMDLSQPSISLLIQALEKDLGKKLFERRGPRIRLTPEGRNLLELALPLIEGLEALPAAFEERINHRIAGEIHIAAGESTILYLLPGPLQRFHEAHPHVRVRLSNVTGQEGLARLRAGEVDFAVGSMLKVPDDIHYAPLVSYDPVLICPPGHPLTEKSRVNLNDISPYGLILPPRNLTTWQIVDLVFNQHHVDYQVTLEAGGWEVIKKYVQHGLGVSIVTSICLDGNDDLVSIPLAEYFPKRTYGLVLRRGRFLSPAARRFIEIMAPGALLDYQSAQARESGVSVTDT